MDHSHGQLCTSCTSGCWCGCGSLVVMRALQLMPPLLLIPMEVMVVLWRSKHRRSQQAKGKWRMCQLG